MTILGGQHWYYGNEETQVWVSRAQLHDLVWSSPMRVLAPELGISDSGLAKLMRQHGIRLPERGYWNKLHAGKAVKRTPLPARHPGEAMLLRADLPRVFPPVAIRVPPSQGRTRMKRKRFTEEQIIGVLRDDDLRATIIEVGNDVVAVKGLRR